MDNTKTQGEPTIGSAAPEFSLTTQHGDALALSARKGVGATLLVFYPYAFSGLCSGELAELKDVRAELDSQDVAVAAISCDPMFALRAWDEEQNWGFPLLSDHWPHGAAAKAYGVFDEERGCSIRGSFLVDRDGILRWSLVNGLGEARPVGSYLQAVQALNQPVG